MSTVVSDDEDDTTDEDVMVTITATVTSDGTHNIRLETFRHKLGIFCSLHREDHFNCLHTFNGK